MMFRLSKLPARFPVAASATFIGARYFLGDSVTQYHEGSPARKSWDLSRSLAFTVFGAYTGVVYGWALFRTYPFLMKQLNCHRCVSGPILEGCYYFPVLYFPGFYVLQDIRATGRFSFPSALKRYKRNIFEDMLNWCKFWPLPMVLCFAYLPSHMIPVYIAIVGFVWVLILSTSRGELHEVKQAVYDLGDCTGQLPLLS